MHARQLLEAQAGQLAQLNQELEARVLERTQALRHAQTAAEATAQRLRRVTESLPSTSFTVDQAGQILYISPQWYAYTGLGPGVDVTAAWPQLLHPDDLPAIAQEFGAALADGGPWRYEFRLRGADGHYRWFASQGVPEPSADAEAAGRTRQWFGSNLDVDDLKRVQQQLAQANAQLTAANRQLTRTNADLDNFIYTASHDLKAPISNIEGLLRLLEDMLPDELRTDDTLLPVLARMQESVERFTRTIGHLTEVSKLQLEFAHPAAPTPLAPLLDDVRQDLAPLLAETHGRLDVDIRACPTLVISEKNLRSLLYNLVSNALKYHHPGRPPVVRLSSRHEDGQRVLRVRDNGLGLSQEQQAKLFQLFGCLHTHVAGTGVGLYMAKKMVESAHSTLTVESRAGEGTTFTASFPA